MSIKSKTQKLLQDNPARFFMPGHKGTLSFYDITEIDGADNLVCPCDEIQKAQENISKIYKSEKSYISVNGSTAAVMAAVITACGGGRIIADRQCHISAVNAMIFGNITPYFIYPVLDDFFGVGTGITPKDVEDAFFKAPDARAVLVTSPTYYGVCSDIEGICKVAHAHGAAVIVDAAHGAHFTFSDLLPKCAVAAGADIVIHSAHKTLCCLTQGAILHCGGSLIDHTRLKGTLNMLQTTSPSYLLMSSVEQSVYDAVNFDYEKLIKNCDEMREISPLPVLGEGFFQYDKTRLVFNGENLDILMREHNIIPEMFDGYNAVLLPTPCTTDREFEMLYNFLKNCSAKQRKNSGQIPKAKTAMPLAEAAKRGRELVPKEKAKDRICAATVYKNPPCMPVICPGEIVTDEILPYIENDIWCIT